MPKGATLIKPYQWTVAACGGLVVLWCLSQLSLAQLDWRFLLLAAVTVGVSSRISVKIPRHDTNITLSDTFIFLAILVYGDEAAVLLAAAEGVSSGFRISKKKKPITILFNVGVAACSTFAAVCSVRLVSGGADALPKDAGLYVAALVTMGIAQYLANSGMVAVGLALKTEQPVGQTWTKHCLWSSITYFVGAALAGVIAIYIDSVGFYAMLAALPVICIVYLTYDKYLEDIKATAAQAELAERARAEAERSRAELAERHVEQQRKYIEELERARKELEESREHFRHAAYHDALTGLPNRALLAEHIKLSIQRAKSGRGHRFAVLFLDLDRFKNVNDSLGHGAGDQLLDAIARRLEQLSRPADTVARTGGDEYAVLLDGLQDHDDAVNFAERLQKELANPFVIAGQEVYVTASVGIALSDSSFETPENLLRDADIAMYRAKEKGKARYEVFDSVMHARAVALLRLENDLRRAIERQEFRVFYQPIVALETRRIVGFEALVRWQHPERGFVPPGEFIPLAEETGLVADIDRWVLRESCRQMAEWQQLAPANRALTLSANLSSKELTQADLVGSIKSTLDETGFDPHCLRLEITESAVMENAETSATMLAQLRDIGVRISIDDFGTGYSSLSYLHRFPVTTLKIDRSFIGRMTEDGEKFEIVRTIMTLANNLGMDTVAEGVETERQLAQLRLLKCEYGQGYLFSKPVDAAAAGALLTRKPQGHTISGPHSGDLIISTPSSPYIN